jgi:hypothetical protein
MFWVAVTFNAWLARFTFALVTGIVADGFSKLIHSSIHLFIAHLDENVVITFMTVALKAVHASVSALLPLLFVTGFWVFNAGFAVVLTPSEVALSNTWFSGNMALDAVSTSGFALFHIAGFWAAVFVAVSTRHAVGFTPSEVAFLHAWVEMRMAIEAWFALITLFWAVTTIKAAGAVFFASTLTAEIVADTDTDHLLVFGSDTDVTSKTVHALVVAPVLETLFARIIQAWETSFTLTFVTGSVTEVLSNMVDKLLFGDTVAFEAVGTSLTALGPLGFVAAHWVFEATRAIIGTPAIVASISALITVFWSFDGSKGAVGSLVL